MGMTSALRASPAGPPNRARSQSDQGSASRPLPCPACGAPLPGGIRPVSCKRLERLSTRPGLLPFVAERVGFEPTNTREDVTGIPVQRLRPLGHLSVVQYQLKQ